MKLLNFGSLNIDCVYQVESIVRPGETVRGLEKRLYCGGKGLNQSIALANAGVYVYHAGIVGEDGQMLIDKLKHHGVNTRFIRKKTGESTRTVIQVDPSGRNSILFCAEEGLGLDREYIQQVLDYFSPGDYVLLQNELDHTGDLIQLSKERGLKVVLNPAPYTAELMSCPLEEVDIFVMNEAVGSALTGEEQTEYILDKMHEKYPDTIVVLTLGEQGACCMADDLVIEQRACVADAVDTTAAGDTFTGYFLAEYLRSQSLESALSIAAKASAITVTLPGAADSIPMRKEVLQ